MKRVSPRRIFFCLGSLLCGLLWFGNVHQTFKAFTVIETNEPELAVDSTENETGTKITKGSAKIVDEKRPGLSSPVAASLPWYMENGVIRPTQPEGPRKRKKRKQELFPDEAPGEDRIICKEHIP